MPERFHYKVNETMKLKNYIVKLCNRSNLMEVYKFFICSEQETFIIKRKLGNFSFKKTGYHSFYENGCVGIIEIFMIFLKVLRKL